MTNRLSDLDKLINGVEAEMLAHEPDSEEYETLLWHLERLRKLKDDTRPKRLDRNTVVLALANLFGIGLIAWTEREHVMNAKALREIIKPKF
jgi:hypothetical protein